MFKYASLLMLVVGLWFCRHRQSYAITVPAHSTTLSTRDINGTPTWPQMNTKIAKRSISTTSHSIFDPPELEHTEERLEQTEPTEENEDETSKQENVFEAGEVANQRKKPEANTSSPMAERAVGRSDSTPLVNETSTTVTTTTPMEAFEHGQVSIDSKAGTFELITAGRRRTVFYACMGTLIGLCVLSIVIIGFLIHHRGDRLLSRRRRRHRGGTSSYYRYDPTVTTADGDIGSSGPQESQTEDRNAGMWNKIMHFRSTSKVSLENGSDRDHLTRGGGGSSVEMNPIVRPEQTLA